MELEPTGERVVEDFYQDSQETYLIYLFHLATYDFATRFTHGKDVLDYGCGSGYGSHRLASRCRSIVGIDVAEDAVEYAKSKYQAENLQFLHVRPAEEGELPFPDGSFDTVTSFQVIEHVEDVPGYLREVSRVLRPGGVFVCATPDRSTRLLKMQKPWNRWHVREFGLEDLKKVLSESFASVEMMRMGGETEVLRIELRRTRRAKWVSLPFTLPFIPEPLRKWALRQLQRVGNRGSATTAEQRSFPFDQSSLVISPDASPSVNLIAVARTE